MKLCGFDVGLDQPFFLISGPCAIETEKLALEKAELAKSWGSNYAANKIVAENAARALGIDPAAVAALEQQVGYGKVMEMFRTIGAKIGAGSSST